MLLRSNFLPTFDHLNMPVNSGFSLALRGFLVAAHIATTQARRWTVNNDCPFTICESLFASLALNELNPPTTLVRFSSSQGPPSTRRIHLRSLSLGLKPAGRPPPTARALLLCQKVRSFAIVFTRIRKSKLYHSCASPITLVGWTGGVIWARRDCDFSQGNTPPDTNTTTGGCVSGGCPGGLFCTGLGTSPTTHAEWTLAPGDGSGADYYDISIVSCFS